MRFCSTKFLIVNNTGHLFMSNLGKKEDIGPDEPFPWRKLVGLTGQFIFKMKKQNRYEYHLIKGSIALPITIQEEAKEDFKKMMGWSEAKFKKHTCRNIIMKKTKQKTNKCKHKWHFARYVDNGKFVAKQLPAGSDPLVSLIGQFMKTRQYPEGQRIVSAEFVCENCGALKQVPLQIEKPSYIG